jgi:predicted TIM-barrel fold metal-dependent hydrolase
LIIDWHSHWIPARLAARAAELRKLPAAPEFSDVDARLRYMDEAGVGRQVISWPTTFGLDAILPPAETAAFYRIYNDELAALVSGHPDRFSGLAAVPVAVPALAVAELERTQQATGIVGAVIPADAFLNLAGAEAHRPLLVAAYKLGRHLYVHPGPTGFAPEGQGPIDFLRREKGSAPWLLETGTRLGAAALTLETSTILDAFPGLSVHVSMLGGHLAWIAETIAFREGNAAGTAQPVWPLRRIFVDVGIVKPGGAAIAHAAAMFGADRMLFGSDFPQFGTRLPAEAFAGSGLDEGTTRKILWENGASLLDSIRSSRPA